MTEKDSPAAAMTEQADMTDIAVGFLAGGLARRMGGCKKALLEIGGQTVLERQLAATANHRIRLINANGDNRPFQAFGLPIVADNIADYPGPLAGILACLDYLAHYHPKISILLSCATDAPFIPNDLAARLSAARQAEEADLAQASSNGRRHPVFGLWPVSLRDELRFALLQMGLRKIDHFIARYRTAIAEFSGQPDPFLNVNQPEDISKAETALADIIKAEAR